MWGRVKLQVWSEKQGRWRTAYCRHDLIVTNIKLLTKHGFMVRTR